MHCKGITIVLVSWGLELPYKALREGVVQYYCTGSSCFVNKREHQMSYSHLVEITLSYVSLMHKGS